MCLTIAVLLFLVHKSVLDQNLNFYPMNGTCIRIFDKSVVDSKQIAEYLNLNSSVDIHTYFQGINFILLFLRSFLCKNWLTELF